LPKDGKIIRPVLKNMILMVRELLFRLSYSLLILLMPYRKCLIPNELKGQKELKNAKCSKVKKVKWEQLRATTTIEMNGKTPD
jgi:hypothetical protein